MGLQILALPSGVVPQAHQAAITYQRGWGKYQRLPMIMFVITGGEYPIVVDSGTPQQDFVRDYFKYTSFEKSEAEAPVTVLEKAGIDPAGVRQVAFTHLHWDHCSNLELFPNATFTVQDTELRYAVKPIPLHNRAYQHLPGTQPPWLSVLNRVNAVQGTVEIAPGVSTVLLPGHTPGSQGVLVETDAGRYLIAGDNLDSYDNWAGDASTPHIPSGAFSNLIEYTESFNKMDALECEPIPSHDQRVLDTKVFG